MTYGEDGEDDPDDDARQRAAPRDVAAADLLERPEKERDRGEGTR